MSTHELTAKVTEYKELQRMAEELADMMEAIKDEIKRHMEQAETDTLVAGAHKVRWTSVVSSRIDSKALKSELPDIYSRYAKESTTRRFTVA